MPSPETIFHTAILRRLRTWVDSFNPYVPERLEEDGIRPLQIEEASIKRSLSKWVMAAFAVFLAWSVTAPLDGGVVISGVVVVEGSRKAVQHPGGGVVQDILAHEGQTVAQGDVLVRINPLNVQANLRQVENEFISHVAQHSRLLSERLDSANINWATELTQLHDLHPDLKAKVTEAKQLQAALFVSRRTEHAGQLSILSRQAQGLRSQLAEKEEILRLRQSQIGNMRSDADSVRRLAAEGFVPKTQAHNAERSSMDAQASIVGVQSEIAGIKTALASNELERARMVSARIKAVDTELAETQKSLDSLKARMESLRFDESLTEIKAPASGVIVASKVNTVGGVITPGQMLMEIVPSEHPLVAEIPIPPRLIDKVRPGQQTDIRFSSLNQNSTPIVSGTVKLVGADRLPAAPPQTKEEYYLGRVEVHATALRSSGIESKSIVPGMPVEVIIKTGERSFMSYLLKPLSDRFARSFKD